MEVTQEAILSLLIADGGKMKNADLLARFKGSLNCADPAEKKQNRELFKSCVNSVAFVKEIDGVRYIVVKKKYLHLLPGGRGEEHRAAKSEHEEADLRPGERPPEEEETCEDGGGGQSSAPDQDHREGPSDCHDNLTESLSPIQLALQRSKSIDFRLKRALNFDIAQSSEEAVVHANETKPQSVHSKPYALPLRMPPSATRVEIHKLKGDSDDPPDSPLDADAFRNKRKPWMDGGGGLSSPQPRRAVKSTKASEEPRFPSTVPLEQAEHEWLVKCAAGHWSQAYGLLLMDNQLAEKRDFMSGFTALHWAAKCGNSEMLGKIIDVSKQGGVDIDINAKAYGGYTPLHIAALHDQEFILAMLVGEYGADASIRDNCGKRAHHYLHKGVSETVREMLGEPKVQPAQESAQHDKEELDLFPDLSKGLHTISRLFQPHVTGHKKKHKQRPAFYSVSDDPREGREDSNGGSKHRVLSDVFM
uniref:Sosondowah ankyrin repeat domain family member A n=2 Tax=Myripristis murdjan TaxID=586833 RepID=A0A667XJ04_9TELE